MGYSYRLAAHHFVPLRYADLYQNSRSFWRVAVIFQVS